MSEKAFVIYPELPGQKLPEAELEERLEEAAGLARAINLDVLDCFAVNVSRVSPANYLSKGIIERIAEQVEGEEPNVVIFDASLSPVQQRNLEKSLNCKVIDRTGLILEIFGDRAQTREGKIQVDLALLEYQRSRLVRAWTHLERQRGATGFMGGPGETQIELDRRIIGDKIAKLKKDLEQVRRTRNLAQVKREKVPFPVVAFVGYTNAGKSTLFNYLTDAGVFAKDLLFATLDPTMRKLELPNGQDVIFSDTVGFISDLPTHLVAAFRATLEQVNAADVIVHVRDISRDTHEKQAEDVLSILSDLGIEYEEDNRIMEVWNKIDKLDEDELADLLHKARYTDRVAPLSALTGEGVNAFLDMVADMLTAGHEVMEISIPVSDGKTLAKLYEYGEVLEREDHESSIDLKVKIDPAFKKRLQLA
jgi:GTPase